MTGCGSLSQVGRNAADTSDDIKRSVAAIAGRVDKVSGVVDQTADKVNNRINQIDDKISEVQKNVSEEIASAISPIDSNGDGKADFQEAISHLKKDNNWQSFDAWVQIVIAVVGSLLGLGAVKKGGKPILAAIHKTGRKELEKQGEPSVKGSQGVGADPPDA